MEELKFKTTLKCGGCKDKITPGMNAIEGIENWDVEYSSPKSVLTVKASKKNVEEQVKNAVEKAGFELERFNA